MTSLEERVQGFVQRWRETHCAECEAELTDGNVVVINGRLVCTKCHEAMKTNGLIANGR